MTRKHRHWEIVIYPEQYDDPDDHGFSWVGVVPARVKDTDAYAFKAACIDCEMTNGWENGYISRDRDETQDSDSGPCVRQAVEFTLANIRAARGAGVTNDQELGLATLLADLLEGWEHQ